LVKFNNVTDVHYWSTLGPGRITGQSSADLAHLGEPRLVTASVSAITKSHLQDGFGVTVAAVWQLAARNMKA
jgi:hypothetical protein